MIRTDHRCVPLGTFKALVYNSQSSDILNIMHSINIQQSIFFLKFWCELFFFQVKGWKLDVFQEIEWIIVVCPLLIFTSFGEMGLSLYSLGNEQRTEA